MFYVKIHGDRGAWALALNEAVEHCRLCGGRRFVRRVKSPFGVYYTHDADVACEPRDGELVDAKTPLAAV